MNRQFYETINRDLLLILTRNHSWIGLCIYIIFSFLILPDVNGVVECDEDICGVAGKPEHGHVNLHQVLGTLVKLGDTLFPLDIPAAAGAGGDITPE